MTPRARGPRPGEAGFVLIGVVIFVLALTIIGMSLYSLSSYEAQFLQRSLDSEQAFQSAVGGIERAKFAVCVPPYVLESVGQNLPLEGVVSATATQVQGGLPVSAGPVVWAPASPVLIRVTAAVVEAGGDTVSRTVEGRFSPQLTQNYYAKVITTSSEIVVDAFASASGPLTDRRYTVNLWGAVWEGVSPPDNPTWKAIIAHQPDSVTTTPVPTPDVATYFASHPVGVATPAQFTATPTAHTYKLHAPQNAVEYFCAPSGYPPNDFYYDNFTAALEIAVEVHGLAVWEFPKGLRFDETVHVSSPNGGNNCLVIVTGQAGPQPTTPETDQQMGIRLFAGLIVDPGISVILVSNGRVYVQHLNNASGVSSIANDLTIYAQNAWLTGPERVPPSPPPQKTMTLQHLVTGDLDTKYIDLLAGLGALPGLSSANGRSLTLLSGTWRAYPR